MGGRARNGGEEGQGEGTRAHTRACIMCQSTKGGCTFSECNIIALEAGTRMPLNQSRSLGLGLQFHILSPSPPRSSFALSLSLLPSPSLFSLPPPPAISTCSLFFARVLLSPCCPLYVSCPSLGILRCLFLVRTRRSILTEIINKPRLSRVRCTRPPSPSTHPIENRGKRRNATRWPIPYREKYTVAVDPVA